MLMRQTEKTQQQKDINGDLKNNCRINKMSLKKHRKLFNS